MDGVPKALFDMREKYAQAVKAAEEALWLAQTKLEVADKMLALVRAK